MKKVQWNSIDKKQNGLKYSKNDKSSTLPEKYVGNPSCKLQAFILELQDLLFNKNIFKNVQLKTLWPGASHWRIYYDWMWGQLLTTCSNLVKQPGTPSCSLPQKATDNGVRDDRSNWLVAPPPSLAEPTERYVHSIK